MSYHVKVLCFFNHFSVFLIHVNLSATLFVSVWGDWSLVNGWLFGWKAGGRIKRKNMGKIICKKADVMQYRPVLLRWGTLWWQRAWESLPALPGCCYARCLWMQSMCQRAAAQLLDMRSPHIHTQHWDYTRLRLCFCTLQMTAHVKNCR